MTEQRPRLESAFSEVREALRTHVYLKDGRRSEFALARIESEVAEIERCFQSSTDSYERSLARLEAGDESGRAVAAFYEKKIARLERIEEALIWIAAGRTGSYGSFPEFARVALAAEEGGNREAR